MGNTVSDTILKLTYTSALKSNCSIEKPPPEKDTGNITVTEKSAKGFRGEKNASTTRRMVERHVWQDALDAITAFTKTHNGKRILGKKTIECSFAEAKENHGLRITRH